MAASEQEPEKRAVAAAVIENAFALELLHEPETDLESAPVAPRDQPIAAEDLLGGVMAIAERDLDPLVAQNFFSRLSHLPRIVIQNDSRISRTSRTNDRRRTYSKSNR